MKQFSSGFTLIELLISISIFSILIGLASPSFSNILDESQVSANVQRLTQTLQLSRSKAISDNVKVTVCPVDKSLNCGADWSTGYMAFVDNNGDRQFNENDILLIQFYSEDERSTLNWRAFGHKKSLQWLETGITNHQNGSFEFCYSDKAKNSRALFITKAGRIRYSKDTNGDEIHENSTGNAIAC